MQSVEYRIGIIVEIDFSSLTPLIIHVCCPHVSFYSALLLHLLICDNKNIKSKMIKIKKKFLNYTSTRVL